MKLTPIFRCLPAAALLATLTLTALHASGGDGGSNYVLVQKQQYFYQTEIGAPSSYLEMPFDFSAQGPVAETFTPPGMSATALTYNSNNSQYRFDESFATLAAMNTAFPDGTYTLALTGYTSFTLSLTGDTYPVVPEVTNGTWNASGQLVIDPTQSTTLDFNTFTTYGTGALSHMQLQIQPYNGSSTSVTQTYITPTNTTPFESYIIAASTLQPGTAYQGQLEYDAVPSDNTTAVSGYTAGAVYSSTTYFTVVTSGTPPNPPQINQQPSNQTAPIGSNVTFNIAFDGSYYVLWFKDNQVINLNNNSQGPSLSLSNIQNSDAGTYYALVINSDGSYVQSSSATLTIGTVVTPSFTLQPASQNIATSATVVFSAAASGSPSYQWSLNGNTLSDGNGISGSQTSLLVLQGTSVANAGTYICTATNSAGSVQSEPASLTVSTTSNPGRLINLSCRADSEAGSNQLIAGYVIGGMGTSGTDTVLIRATGPTLASFGVGGVLPDPELTLNQSVGSSNVLVASNSGWANSTTVAETAASVGAFSWPANSVDAALVETLGIGAYTAQVTGVSNDSGVALAEVYDTTPSSSYTPTSPRLINISARVNVGTGGNVLIAGFVIGGSTSKTVLIRGSGPVLKNFGLSGYLPDPQLSLFQSNSNQTNTLLQSNTGWGGSPQIATAASQVGAFSWGSAATADSALLVTLPPGAYTAEVSGASNDTGVSLVEVYDVP